MASNFSPDFIQELLRRLETDYPGRRILNEVTPHLGGIRPGAVYQTANLYPPEGRCDEAIHQFSIQRAQAASYNAERAEVLANENQRRYEAQMRQSMETPIFNPDQMNLSPPLVALEEGEVYRFVSRPTKKKQIPLEDMPTHDITIGRQRRIHGPHMARPFAKSIPDSRYAGIFDKPKWRQVEITIEDIDRNGRDKYFEVIGKSYLEMWKRAWKKTRE